MVDTFTNYGASDIYMAWFRGALALDAAGIPHVAYTVNKSNIYEPSWAMYAYKTRDGNWVRDTIEFRPSSNPMIGYDADIDIDDAGNPHIVYNYYGGDARYAFWNGSDWTIRNISCGASYGVAIDLDLNNNPHIAIGTLDILKYAFSEDGGITWTIETVEPAWWHCDIKVDSLNVPHIVYARLDTDYRHAVRLGPSSWRATTIEYIGAPNICRPTIEIDVAGNIHVAYYPYFTWPPALIELKYAISSDGGASWALDSVASARVSSTCNIPSFAMGSTRKFIAYQSPEFKLSYAYSDIVGVKEENHVSSVRSPLSLTPNPFREAVVIAYQLPQKSILSLKVYNIYGRIVCTLVHKEMETGIHKTNWDGRDENGIKLPSGVYFCTLEMNGYKQTEKVLLIM